MEFKHIPVMFNEVMEALNIKSNGIYIDGTVGGGGHSSGICERLGEGGTLIAVDRDEEALKAAKQRLESYKCNKRFIHSNYSRTEEIFKNISSCDGILLDLGVSSFQLDNADRGFSYMQDARLDMRMDEDEALSAYDVVNGYGEDELKNIIKDYGEERWASRIAEFIVRYRNKKNIDSTGELVQIIKSAIPAGARRNGPHPAKRTFQAIRIEVNGELDHLRKAVTDFPNYLNSGGRMAVITFHSLEDRIVKESFNKRLNPCTCPPELPFCVCGKKADIRKITKKPIVANKREMESNPRSRSAKLRVIEKLYSNR